MPNEVTDIDELRRELEASQLRTNGILETAVNAIVTISELGLIESANASTERMFGYSRVEMIGRNISMLMPEPYRSHHDHYLAHYRQTGQRKIIGIGREVTGQRKDGSVFPLDLSVGEVKLSSGRIFTGIMRDLSERKALEERLLSISEEEQARIGQDIHDDLCQQLAAIGCLAQVASRQLAVEDRPEAQQLAEITRLVSQANVRAREMARGLMPVVRDSGALVEALSALASSTERIFRVSCPFHSDRQLTVADNKVATQLFRIAQEAVANAIKHSNADRIEVALERHGEDLVLSVHDNGTGIVENTSEQPRGIGMFTMNQRARMIGGSLIVDSRANGGTSVRCTVRCLDASDAL